MKKTIAIASDHAGFVLKEALKKELGILCCNVRDLGTDSVDSVDYPDYGYKLADLVANNDADAGVIICGSGIGISIAANRNPKARAALCHDTEAAELARKHNDANILALGSRVVSEELAKEILRVFLQTCFEGGRHSKRVEKLGNGYK